ncbi:MAG: O-antigen ligase family protein, partial [Candidatus Omnitrophota bacterium]
KEKKINIFYLFTVMFFSVLILTKSLGGILSLVISFLVLFLIIKPKNIPKKFLILGLIILTFLCVFVFFARANRIVDFRNPHNSLLQRYNFIRVSIKIARDNLLWGVGMGNFGDFFMRYRSASDIRTNYAHNFILQTQTELGILGSVGLFLLILVFLRDIFTKKNKLCFFNFSLLWAGTSFLFHNLIDISFFFPEVAIFFWIIWAGFKNLSK